MMNNEQMVSVPRERLREFIENAACLGRSPQWVKNKVILLDALAQPAAQHQGEPVEAIPLKDCVPGWHSDYNEGLFATADAVVTLYLHPPTSDGFSAGDMADQGAKAFAARDGEVERLRAELAQCEAMAAMIAEREWAEHAGTGDVSSKVEAAFTQLHNDLHEADVKLAERDALLREQSGKLIVLAARLIQEPLRVLGCYLDNEGPITRNKATHGVEQASDSLGGLALEVRRVADALSASADPSTPVERDERADFESWVATRKVCTHKGAKLHKDRSGSYLDYRINDRWLTWQARAALERKQ